MATLPSLETARATDAGHRTSGERAAPRTQAAGPAEGIPCRAPLAACAFVGLGGLFAGVTGPLLSAFVRPIVRDVLGDHRAAIGLVMAIDNVLLLLLVPWAGAASDRSTARGHGRQRIILPGLALAAVGMAVLPGSVALGITGVAAAIVVLYTGINIQRSPFQALVADLVPSRDRSLATGSATFQMCAGAIVFLMLGRVLGMQPAFLMAAGTVAAIAVAVALDRLGSLAYSMPLLAVASASWTLPAVNAYPLFVEPIPRSSRGVLAALFLLCMALGGAVGDPLNGALFDLFEGYRPLFVMMAVYTVLASVAVLFVPKGAGEADTGALSEGPARRA